VFSLIFGFIKIVATYSADYFRQLWLPTDSQLFFNTIITKNVIYGDDSTIIANWHYDRFLPLVVLSEMTLTFDFQAECHFLIYTFFLPLSLYDTADKTKTRYIKNKYFLDCLD
jgi:hypothetical protein